MSDPDPTPTTTPTEVARPGPHPHAAADAHNLAGTNVFDPPDIDEETGADPEETGGTV